MLQNIFFFLGSQWSDWQQRCYGLGLSLSFFQEQKCSGTKTAWLNDSAITMVEAVSVWYSVSADSQIRDSVSGKERKKKWYGNISNWSRGWRRSRRGPPHCAVIRGRSQRALPWRPCASGHSAAAAAVGEVRRGNRPLPHFNPTRFTDFTSKPYFGRRVPFCLRRTE